MITQEAARTTLSLNSRRVQVGQVQPLSQPQVNHSGKTLDRNNGHEIILRTMISKRQRILLTLNDSTVVEGRLTQFDKWTITIYPDDNGGRPETFFKHSLRSFTIAD